MIAITDKTVGIWYLDTIPNKQDWMAGLTEIEPESKYQIDYRFRYYEDDKAFDSKGRKSWYKVVVPSTRAFAIAVLRELAKHLAEAADAGGELIEILNEGDIEAFTKKITDSPFAYSRMATKEETAKLQEEAKQ